MSVYDKRSRPDTWLTAASALLMRILLVAAVGYFLYRVGFIIVVVVMAVMFALATAPAVDWLCKSGLLRFLPRKLRRNVAVTIVFVALAILLFQLGVLMIRPLGQEIQSLIRNWPNHQAQWEEMVVWSQRQWAQLPPDAQEWLARQWAESKGGADLGRTATEQLSRIVHRTVESGMFLVELILIPVLAFSFLTESRPLKRELAVVLPVRRVKDGLYLLRQTGIILQSYAVGQIILATIAGVVVWLLLVGLGVRYALALAVIAAITRVIPVVGPIIGGIPIVLMSVLQGWEKGVAVLIAFSVLHLVESKIIMPRLIGYRIHLHPAVVIIVLLIGAEFFGMWGMFLAAPVAAVLRTVFRHFFLRPVQRGDGPASGATRDSSPSQKEPQVERSAVGGVRSHSGAH